MADSKVPVAIALAWHAGRLGLPMQLTGWPADEAEAVHKGLRFAKIRAYTYDGEPVIWPREPNAYWVAALSRGVLVDCESMRQWSDRRIATLRGRITGRLRSASDHADGVPFGVAPDAGNDAAADFRNMLGDGGSDDH